MKEITTPIIEIIKSIWNFIWSNPITAIIFILFIAGIVIGIIKKFTE